MEDLATVWCEWCEMELRHKNFKRALELMRRATYTPDKINRREVCLGIAVIQIVYQRRPLHLAAFQW